jgi:5-methyltetrahydrofolate--homocysteine methyltransferase
LPNRVELNSAFLAMLIGAGLTSAIVNPLHPEIMTSITAAEVLAGVDDRCKRWMKRCRRLAKAAKSA